MIKYDSVDGYLYATFSKRFIIRNMKPAERRQSTIKTDHTIVRGMSFHKKPPTLTSRLPIAVATNHPPNHCTLIFWRSNLANEADTHRTKQQLTKSKNEIGTNQTSYQKQMEQSRLQPLLHPAR